MAPPSATDAHFLPDKAPGATGKSLIVLNPSLSLNQRVPGSSPGAPTKQIKHLERDVEAERLSRFAVLVHGIDFGDDGFWTVSEASGLV